MIPAMLEREQLRQRQLTKLRHIAIQAELADIKPSRLSKEAGLGHNFISRKLSDKDVSVIKQESLAALEEAASRLIGRPLPSAEALMADLDAVNHEFAQAMDDLLAALLKRGVIQEQDLSPRLQRLMKRRRQLMDLLGIESP